MKASYYSIAIKLMEATEAGSSTKKVKKRADKGWLLKKTDSPGYDTPGRLTRWGIIPRVVMLWQIFS